MAGIILAGVSGSRLITAEVDKRALTSTATTLVAEVQVLKGRPSPGVNFSTTAPFKFREDVQKLLNP